MSLIQQALKRQQDEAKGKIVLPPPHLGSTQLAVKPVAPVKPPLFSPAPPIAAPEHTGDESQRLKLVPPPPPVAPVPPVSSPMPEPPVMPVHVNALKLSQPPVVAEASPAPVSVEPPVREESSGLKSARILILLLLVAVAIYWFWWRPKNVALETTTDTTSNTAVAGATKDAAPATGLTEGQPVVKNSGVLPDVKDIKSKVDAMQSAVATANDQNAEIEKGIAPVPAPVTPAPVTPAPVAPVVVAPVVPVVAPVVATPPPVVNLDWPTITVNGVMPHTVPSKASAIINGNVVAVGEEVDGMTIREVRERGVLMEMKGQQKLYGIGRR